MKKGIVQKLGLVCLVAAVVAACSPQPANQMQQEIDQLPSWYTNPPQDNDEFLYSSSSSTSSRREVARNKAELDAKTGLAQKLGEKIEALEKRYLEEIGSGGDTNTHESFTQAQKSITGETLTGVSTDKVHFMATPDNRYECFILVKYPVGDARSSLENALSRDKELYVKFKESKAFEELQNDLSRIGKDQ